jgi:hypothetical protein
MKFEDDDLKDGKLWAALQKEIDRDLAEKESGETFQEELADIEDSIEFESKETKSEDHIPDETANLSNLRSVLEATERAKDEEAKQKMKQTKVEPVTQDIEIPEFTEEEEEIEETPAETKTESEPEEVMVDDDLIINDPFADEDDLLGEEKTETKGSEKEVLGDQVEAAMERLVSDTVGHIPMPEIDDEDDDYDDYEDDDEEYIPHGAKPQKKKGKGGYRRCSRCCYCCGRLFLWKQNVPLPELFFQRNNHQRSRLLGYDGQRGRNENQRAGCKLYLKCKIQRQ